MGGDLQQAPPGKSPTFLVAALKDPIGANLDRLQVVKGWLDSKVTYRRKSMMSPGPEAANPERMASCRR